MHGGDEMVMVEGGRVGQEETNTHTCFTIESIKSQINGVNTQKANVRGFQSGNARNHKTQHYFNVIRWHTSSEARPRSTDSLRRLRTCAPMPCGTLIVSDDRIDMPLDEEEDDEEECESLDGDEEDEEEDADDDDAEKGMRQCADGSSANSCAMVVGGSISRGKSTRWSSSSGARVSRS
jgi:hypothetical protein